MTNKTARQIYDRRREETASQKTFEEVYVGCYISLHEFAESEFIAQVYKWEEFEKKFPFWSWSIDWSAVAFQLENNGQYEFYVENDEEKQKVYVFHSF